MWTGRRWCLPRYARMSNRRYSTKAGDQLSKSTVGLVFGTAIDLLVAWIQQPSLDARRRLANWLPLMGMLSAGTAGTRTSGDSLPTVALAAIDGAVQVDPSGDTYVWRDGGFAFAVRMPGGPLSTEIALVIDDFDSALSAHVKDIWREWLRWSNLLNFRSLPASITTRRHSRLVTPPVQPGGPPAPVAALTGDWRDAYEQADPEVAS